MSTYDISKIQLPNGDTCNLKDNNAVHKTDYATSNSAGIMKAYSGDGIATGNNGAIYINRADSSQIKAGENRLRPIVPYNQHESTFYGLAKVAGADMASSSNAVGTYTDEAKGAIQNMLGINSMIAPIQTNTLAIQAYGINDLFWYNGKLYKATAAIAQNGNIVIGTNCVETKLTDSYIRNDQLPAASTTTAGIVQLNDTLDSTSVTQAATANTVKEVYGLAKKSELIKHIQTTNLIHIEDAAAKPLKECKIEIQPVQDLHGYDKPWVGGSGKNLAFLNLDNDNPHTLNAVTFTNVKVDGNIIGINGNGTPNSNNNFYVNGVSVTSGIEYKLCNYTETGTTTTYWVRFVFRDSNGTALNVNGSPFIDINALSSKTVTAPSNAVSLHYYINFLNGVAINNVVFKFAIYVSSSAPISFEPYSNICPITGWTGAKVTRTGKNLLPSNLNVYQSVGAYFMLPNFIPENVEAHFTFEDNDTSIDISNCFLGFTYDVTNSSLAYRWVISNGIMSQNTTNISGSGTGRQDHPICSNIFIFPNTTETLQKLFARYKIMVEIDSTITPYEPYTGETIEVQFPAEAGTVYGGTLNVTTGELVVDRAGVDLGTLTWIDENNTVSGQFRCNFTNYKPKFGGNLICSILKGYPLRDWDAVQNGEITLSNSAVLPLLRVRDSLFTNMSATEIAEYLNGQTLVYELDTSITYQLTPQEITTLLGTNNIWTDTGNISCTYYVNSQLNTELDNYIPKSLGTAKGDMIYYSNNNTPSRLEIGNQGQILKVNSDGLPYWNNENIAEYKTLTNQEVATFNDGVQNSVLKSYSIKIEPKQDLHGYNKPWIGGSGKNLCAGNIQAETNFGLTVVLNSDGTFLVTGQYSRDTTTEYYDSNKDFILPSGTYILSGTPQNNLGYALRVKNGSTTLCSGNNSFTLSEQTTVRIALYVPYSSTGQALPTEGLLFKPMIRLASETNDSYEPYENICPIEGYDTVNVGITGKNLIAGTFYNINVGSHSLAAGGNQFSTCYAKVKKGENYVIVTADNNAVYGFIDKQQIESDSSFCNEYPDRFVEAVIVATDGRKYQHVTAQITGWLVWRTTLETIDSCAIYQGTELLNDPCQSKKISINLVSSAGSTIYGGIITINEDGSGTLTLDKEMYIQNGSGNISILSNFNSGVVFWDQTRYFPLENYSKEYITNLFATDTARNSDSSSYGSYIFAQTVRYKVPKNIAETINQFKAYLAEHPLQMVYSLTEPIIYPLTANQLTILLGTNHIWADAGNITITYPVNLKGYIDSINTNINNNLVKNTDTIPVNQGGTGKTSFTADYVLVGNGTNAIAQKALKITGTIGNDVTLQPDNGKTMNLKSFNTLYLDSGVNASHIFRKDTTEFARFNVNGKLQLGGYTGTQNTHELFVNGNSAFNGKIAFGTTSGNNIVEKAYMQYNTTDNSIDFIFV